MSDLLNESHRRLLPPDCEGQGELYCPSNRTEGDMFMARWCERCKRFNPNTSCLILVATWIYFPTDAKYPRQWRFGPDGQPECTEWEELK